MIDDLILCVALVGLFGGLLGLIRNDWVYRERMKILQNDGTLKSLQRANKEYARLPSYDTMMWRWWVWDIEKFKEVP